MKAYPELVVQFEKSSAIGWVSMADNGEGNCTVVELHSVSNILLNGDKE